MVSEELGQVIIGQFVVSEGSGQTEHSGQLRTSVASDTVEPLGQIGHSGNVGRSGHRAGIGVFGQVEISGQGVLGHIVGSGQVGHPEQLSTLGTCGSEQLLAEKSRIIA